MSRRFDLLRLRSFKRMFLDSWTSAPIDALSITKGNNWQFWVHPRYGLFGRLGRKEGCPKKEPIRTRSGVLQLPAGEEGWTMIQFNFKVGVRGSISNVDRTDPLSFTSTIKDLVITSRINLDRIRRVVANRTFQAHDLMLRSY